MASDMFLMIDGMKGELEDSSQKGGIGVESFSWGASNPGSQHFGGKGGGTAKVSVQDMLITKLVDKSSTELFLACSNGKHIPKAVLTVRKAGESPLEFLKYTMENCIVSSYQVSGSGDSGLPMESLSLNFAKIKVFYATQTEKGGRGEVAEVGWNIQEGKKM